MLQHKSLKRVSVRRSGITTKHGRAQKDIAYLPQSKTSPDGRQFEFETRHMQRQPPQQDPAGPGSQIEHGTDVSNTITMGKHEKVPLRHVVSVITNNIQKKH